MDMKKKTTKPKKQKKVSAMKQWQKKVEKEVPPGRMIPRNLAQQAPG